MGRNSYLKWNTFERLHAFSQDGDIAEYKYAYDPLGRRVRKTKIDSRGQVPQETTWFIWDVDAMVGEVKQTVSNSQQVQFYAYRQESFIPLAMQTQAREGQNTKKALSVYQNDPNGMPLRLLAENGEIVWEGHYTAHGQIDSLDAQLDQPLRLQGQYFDKESGLHYNRYRYYDTGVGCFVSPDPIGLVGGLSPYRFADNAFSWIDPLGLLKCGLTGKEVGNASNLAVIKPGSREWTTAVKTIKRGGKTNFRATSQEDAIKLVQEARGPMARKGSTADPYNNLGSDYRKGYEVHPSEALTKNAPENNLPHIKWSDWSTGKSGGGKGHVFF
jgi:RHS repeat-associated protein